MINIFDFASDDKSLQYLQRIFGYMNGVIPVVGGGDVSSGAGASISLLGTMFKTFNTLILAVAVLIVVYTIVVSVMATAHEGEFMGKKWHSLWVPIRMVLGISALVPTVSGYCGLQLVMMWVIVQGIGAADTLWNTVLAYVDVAGSPFVQTAIPSIGYKDSLNTLFRGLVCDASARKSGTIFSTTPGGYYCSVNPQDGYCASSPSAFNENATTYSMGPGGQCGTLTYCNQAALCTASSGSSITTGPDSLKCKACQGEIKALSTIIPTLASVANLYVDRDYEYRKFYSDSLASRGRTVGGIRLPGIGSTPRAPSWVQEYCTANNISPCATGSDGIFNPQNQSGNPPQDLVNKVYWPYGIAPAVGDAKFIDVSMKLMTNGLQELFKQFNEDISRRMQDPTQMSAELQEAQRTGWMLAGAYYFTISKVNNDNLKDVMPVLAMGFPDGNNPSAVDNAQYIYRNNYEGAKYLIGSSAPSGSGATSAPGVDELSGVATELTSAIQQNTESALSSAANPLMAVQQAGFAILLSVEVAFVYFMAVSFALALPGHLTILFMGTGVINPVGPALSMVFILVVPAILAFFGILISMGALLGVYLPLIPYIIFTVSALGWLLSTIETMVAGPLVALGILAPGGQHELLGHAHHALMLIFNVFLRPSLMIFGLIAGMLLASVALLMINAGFGTVMKGIGTLDPLGAVFFLVAYVTLIVTALNKCFSAIHVIPERVVTWIGGQAPPGGEAEALHEAKGAVTGAARSAGGAAGTAGGAPKQAYEARRAQQGAKEQAEFQQKEKKGEDKLEGK